MKRCDIREDLHAYISEQKIINTHCHHLSDGEYHDVDLFFILSHSYPGWMSPPPAVDARSIEKYINDNRCNSYFRWLFTGLKELYGLDITDKSYFEINERIIEANKDKSHHLFLLRNICGYERILLDKYDNLCSDNGHADVFTPVYRIDAFMCGYNRQGKDRDGICPFDVLRSDIMTLEDYVSAIHESIRTEKDRGIAALKSAIAYDRDIRFSRVSKNCAQRAFGNPCPSYAQIEDFQNYILYEITKAAEINSLPFQIHTGLGCLDNTRAIGLRNLIKDHPAVRFDVFHAGYPWVSDVLALLHNYKNVYVNLCWLPLISPREAKDFIIKALEVSSAKRICWGCDTWTSEESFGAVLAIRYVLSEALADMIMDGAIDTDYAKYIAKRILYDNPKELYFMTL